MSRTDARSNKLFLAAFVFICTLFIAARIGDLFTLSSDFAYHSELVVRLAASLGGAATLTDNTWAWMSAYPHYAHALTAVIALLCQSPALGVHLVSLAAVIVVWTSWTVASKGLPQPVWTLNCLALAGLFLLNDDLFHFEVFGQEIVGNFFFAQLVGNALAGFVVAIAVIFESSGESAFGRYSLLGFCAWLLANVYLISALQVLGFLSLLVITDLAWSAKHGTKTLLLGAVTVLVPLLLIVSGSQFRTMMGIAVNNGGLPLRYTPEPEDVLMLALIVAVISAAWLAYWARLADRDRRRWAYARAVALFGIATAGLCLIQFIALQLGYGSPYSVKKYAFALNSIVLLMLALALSAAMAPACARLLWARSIGRLPASAAACLLPLALLWAPSFAPASQTIDLGQLIRAERFARTLRDAALGDPAPLHDYAIDVSGASRAGDYYLSRVALKAPAGENANAILTGQPPPHPEQARYILTSTGAGFWDAPACRRTPPASGLVFVEASCVLKNAIPDCAGAIDMSSRGRVSPYAIEGMSVAESFGRWSDGDRAAFTCRINQSSAPRLIKLVTNAFLPAGRRQRLIVSIAGGEAVTYVYDASNSIRDVTLPIPPTALASSELRVSFAFPDALSPREAGISADTRRLAIGFAEIVFQ